MGNGKVNTEVTLCGIKLDNPVIAASGTYGYGREFSELYDINILGTFSFKGTTEHLREGNPTPRIAETPSGMLNAVGLQNPGVRRVISEELPELRRVFRKPVMANVSGFTVDEYCRTAEALAAEDCVGWIELNISCPNVHGGGMAFGASADEAYRVVCAVRRVCNKPLIPKLSPNVADIAEIARACEAAGADAVSLINTLLCMRIDLKRRAPVLQNRTGGLSGPALLPLALRMVWDVYEAVKIPVVGGGGVSSAEDVLEMMLAGAAAVEIGAANLVSPFASRDIILELPHTAKKYQITDLSEITGGAHRK